jgi:D-alanyl-D-alanine carboxypeptidase
MKKLLLIMLAVASLSSCKKTIMDQPIVKGNLQNVGENPKADTLKKLLKKYTAEGIPGAVIAVKDDNGLWIGADGYAKLEDKTKMSPAMLQIGRSITKIVTATAIMQLKEKGRVDLDKPIKDYLPASLHSLVPKTNVVTVRMLLNQTSGYSEYIDVPEFQQRWLDNPLTVWTRAELQDLIKRTTKISFTPGTDFKYSNTNYYLLSLVIDHITGEPHGKWFQQNIFDKLGLNESFYKQSPGYPFYNSLPNTYFPRFDNGKLENNTRANLAWEQNEEYGTVGLIATPANYISLMDGLVNGRLVSSASLNEMKQWVKGSRSSEPDYGLGLSYWGYKSKPNFGHDGDGVGCHSLLLYFPTSKTYVFIAVNASTQFGGKIQQTISSFQNEICNYLASF